MAKSGDFCLKFCGFTAIAVLVILFIRRYCRPVINFYLNEGEPWPGLSASCQPAIIMNAPAKLCLARIGFLLNSTFLATDPDDKVTKSMIYGFAGKADESARRIEREE